MGTSPLIRRDATVQALRYWDYYGMTELFTDLYDRAASLSIFSYKGNHHVWKILVIIVDTNCYKGVADDFKFIGF